MITKVKNFFGEVKVELQKCSWPWDPKEKGFRRYKELMDSTLVVVIAMLLLGGYVALFDFVLVNVVHFFTRIRKFIPGYLIVNMHLLDENNQLIGRTWYFIRDTPGVIGFAGTKDKPIPMRQSEVDNMLAQMKEREEKVKPKVSFEVGETVKVADGPFQNQNGIVEEIDPERGKLRVSVTIFGRATPVELEYWQVERG